MTIQGSFEKISFLINLDKRPDRWNYFIKNSANLKFKVTRFSAVDAENLDARSLKLPPPVVACWTSHQEVARTFLSSSAKYCLILEDDISLTTESTSKLNKLWECDLEGVDLLQVGFCIHANRLANRANYKVQRCFVRILSLLGFLDLKIIQKRISKIYGYDFSKLKLVDLIVANSTFELGTHAYLISRKFAEAMLQFNTPVYLPADLAIMELAQSGYFNSFRLLESLVGQTDSPSSIPTAASNILEKRIQKMSLDYDS
jgi:GR25 family glycosyltransferase involved in LPS biosynthesis